MSIGVICLPHVAYISSAASYSAKAKETKVEVMPERSREILSYNPHPPLKSFPKTKVVGQKLPRGVHPAGKFRVPTTKK